MTKELTKKQMCLYMRNGVMIWIDEDNVKKLEKVLQSITGHKFVLFEEQTINTADVVGIFSPEAIEDLTRRKNGGWKCKKGNWHDKGEDCMCLSQEEKRAKFDYEQRFRKEHGFNPLPHVGNYERYRRSKT